MHLLSFLDVVAIFQALSLESKSYSPLPIETIVSLYPTIKS